MTTAHDPTDPVGKADTSARDNARATPEAVVAAIVARLVVESQADSEADPDLEDRTEVVRVRVDSAAAEEEGRVSVADDRAGHASMIDSETKIASGCPSRPSQTSSTRTTRS